MTIVVPNFVNSFCRDLVTRAAGLSPAVTLAYHAGSPRSLWMNRAVEAQAADVYTVVRITGGSGTTWDPLPRLSLQVMTVAKPEAGGVEAALNRAQTIFELQLDAAGRPTRMRSIAGHKADADQTADGTWTIVSIDPLQRPTPIGPDANRREQVSFNLDLGYFKGA